MSIQTASVSIATACATLLLASQYALAEEKLGEQVFQERLRAMESLVVVYQSAVATRPVKAHFDALPVDLKARLVPPTDRDDLWEIRFMHRAGAMVMDRTVSKETEAKWAHDNPPQDARVIIAVSPGRTELYRRESGEAKGVGMIMEKTIPIEDWVIDLALGLRPGCADVPLSPEKLPEMKSAATPDGKLTVTMVDTRRRQHTWLFGEGTPRPLVRYETGMQGELPLMIFQCSDFEVIRGVALPKRIVETQFSHDPTSGKRVNIRTSTLEIREYQFPEADEPLLLPWPKDTPVIDERLATQLLAESEGQMLDEKAIHKQLQEQESREKQLQDEAKQRIQSVTGEPSTKPAQPRD